MKKAKQLKHEADSIVSILVDDHILPALLLDLDYSLGVALLQTVWSGWICQKAFVVCALFSGSGAFDQTWESL